MFRFAPEIPISISSSGSRFPDENPQARYLLLVEGVDETYYNPDFDWSRYLPGAVPLSRSEHDRYAYYPFSIPSSPNPSPQDPRPPI